MQHRRYNVTNLARTLALVLAVGALLAGTFGSPFCTQASSFDLAPRMGPGNELSMGSRDSGIFFEYTIDGADCGERQSDGAVTCTLTSDAVTASGTVYVSLGEGLYTRPSAEAKLGQEWAPTEEWQQVSWPPPEMRDTEGYVSGPFAHEEAFSFAWDVKPEWGAVIFNLWVGKVNGTSEGAGVGVWMYPPAATDTPAAVPTSAPLSTSAPLPSSVPPPAPPNFPCTIPLAFYRNQDFRGFYTGAPSLNYTQDQLVQDLVNGLDSYLKDQNSPINPDGTVMLQTGIDELDVGRVASTFRSKTTLPGFKERGEALQEAARAYARAIQGSGNPNYRMSPGELLKMSLQLNNGNVRDALITCHAATYRQSGANPNGKFVEQEGILAPIRNPEGYADTTWSWKTQVGKDKPISPRNEMGNDQQGVWYHLYGLAALEYVDAKGAASFYAAEAILLLLEKTGDDPTMLAAIEKIKREGYPTSGLGGPLGDLAIALEEAKRSVEENRAPDVDKQCVNYWALQAGAQLRKLVASKVPPTVVWKEGRLISPPGGHSEAGTTGTISKHVIRKSPLSLRIDGINGEWFSFDEKTQTFDGNTPWVIFDFFPEQDGTTGLIVQPLFPVSSMQMTATVAGPAQIATYDPATRRAESYELTVQPGDQIYIPGKDEPALLNGTPLTPVATTVVRKPFPVVPVAAGAGGVLVVAAAGAVVLRRRSRRARRSAAPPAPMPLAPAATAPGQGSCPACGSPLKPGIKFCGSCGAAVPTAPPACPHCGQAVNPGARFCGSCGSAVSPPHGSTWR